MPAVSKATIGDGPRGVVAAASILIDAPPAAVWDALVTPEIVKQYMFGTEVVSDWEQGGPILWKGVWKGKPYEDKGSIIRIEPERLLQYSHFSPLSGLDDVPANYHLVTYELSGDDDQTRVSLSQDNNADEKAARHSVEMWKSMLDGLKQVVEAAEKK